MPSNSPTFSLEEIAFLVQSPLRLQIIAHLTTGNLYPTSALARLCGVSANAMGKQIALLRTAGLVYRGPGDIPFLTDRLPLSADRTEIDLGAVVIRIPQVLRG